MCAALGLLFGEFGEEAFNKVQPGSACRREVNMPSCPTCEPISDCRRLVSGVIVHDDMNVHVLGNIGFDLSEELFKFLGAMAVIALADDLAGRGVEGGEQRRRSVPCIVMGAPLGRSRH